MPSTTEFTDLESNLRQTQGNVGEVKGVVTSARETAQDVEDIVGIFRDIENRANDIENTLYGLGQVTRLVGKISVLRAPAEQFRETLEKVERRVEEFEKRAGRLADDVEPTEEQIKNGRLKLESYEDRLGAIEDGVGSLRTGVSSTASSFTVIAAFNPGQAEALNAAAAPVNDAVVAVNDFYEDAQRTADNLLGGITDSALISELKAIQNALSSIADELEFLRDPLAFLSSVIKPVEWALDAVDFVYNAVVAPVVDPILNALGVDKLLDTATAFIEAQLGVPRLDLLEDAEEYIDSVLDSINIDPNFDPTLGKLPDAPNLLEEFAVPFEGLVGDIRSNLLDPFDLGRPENAPTAGADVLIGGGGVDAIFGDANVLGALGADVLSGGGGDDQLVGEAGDDLFIGGGGDDVIDGGAGDDAAFFGDALSTYSITTEDIGAFDVVIDHVLAPDPDRDDGRDSVVGVETFIFSDFQLPLSAFDAFQSADASGVLNGTPERDFLFGRKTETTDDFDETIRGFDPALGDVVGDDDYLAGLGGDDLLLGGEGDDFLDGGAGGDTIDGGPGIDVVSYAADQSGQIVFLDETLVLSQLGSTAPLAPVNALDTITNVENVAGSRFDDQIFGDGGANELDGGEGRDDIYGFGGDDVIDGGDGIDTIVAGDGDDRVFGGDGLDIFVGGLGNDFYDGGEGFDALDYEVRDPALDTIENTLPDFVIVDYGDGAVEKYLLSGGPNAAPTLAGIDQFVNIANVGGGDGDDTIEIGSFVPPQNVAIAGEGGDDILIGPQSAPNQFSIEIFGGDGDDEIWANDNTFAFAGPGDDVFKVVDLPSFVDGGDDVDTFEVQPFDQATGAGSLAAWRLSILSPQSPNVLNANAVLPDGIGETDAEPDNGVFSFLITVSDIERFELGDQDDVVDLDGYAIRDLDADTSGGFVFKDVAYEVLGGAGNDTLRADAKTSSSALLNLGDTLRGGEGDDILIANWANGQVLDGGAGDDVLNTSPGVFVLESGSQVEIDQLTAIGGDGDDRFELGRGRTEIDGGAGIDTLDFYSDNLLSVLVDLAAGAGGIGPSDTYVNVENVWGSDASDTLLGDDSANRLLGHAGGDDISGRDGDDVIYGHAGDDDINAGPGDDFIHGGSGADRIVGGDGVDTISYAPIVEHGDEEARFQSDGLRRFTIDLEAGASTSQAEDNDVVSDEDTAIAGVENVIGGFLSDKIFGDAGVNVLSGGGGDDEIDGRAGDDLLTGGDGDDILKGGAGQDRILSGAGGDVIDGGAGFDILDYAGAERGVVFDLDAQTVTEESIVVTAVWEDIGDPAANGASDPRLWTPGASFYVTSTPEAIFRADPLFAETAQDLRNYYEVGGRPTSENVEIELVFDPNDPTIAPMEVPTGRDLTIAVIEEIAVDVDAYQNIERLVGGIANDRFIMGATLADVDGAGGVDTADYSNEQSAIIYSLLDQTSFGAAAGDLLVGVENLIGTDFNDTLTGDAGANVLEGGLGGDIINGFDGFDLASYEGADTAAIVSFAANTVSGAAAGDVIVAVEGLRGSRFADRFTGDAGVNRLEGLAGDDVLDGLSGADTLSGGAGDDKLLGGDGDDVASGDDGDDSVFGGPGRDKIIGGAGRDTLSGEASVDSLFGGLDGDFLFGGDGADTLSGEAGNDALFGGTGGDKLLGGDGDDTLNGEGAADSLFGGVGDDKLIGGAGDDLLNGEDGDDELFGGTGDDILIGGDGEDRIQGESGDDRLFGGLGRDILQGGDGVDVLQGEADDDVIFGGLGDDLALGGFGDETINGEAGNDALFGAAGADRILGAAGDDLLSGEVGADALFGGDGEDRLLGGRDDDSLQGEGGRDALFGGLGDDFLSGGAEDDSLFGESGDDTLIGGVGDDALFGGDGDDVFVYALSGFGDDTIFDFEIGSDTFVIDDALAASFSDIGVSQSGDDAIITFGDGSVRLAELDATALTAAQFDFI